MTLKVPIVHILDDDPDFAKLVAANLGRAGEFRIQVFTDAMEFIERCEHDLPDAVITDLRMPGMDGVSVTRRLRKSSPYLPIFLLTGHADLHSAIDALKAGATDYLTKPPNVTELATLLRRAVGERPLREDAAATQEHRKHRFSSHAILGEHPLMEATRKFIDQLAAVPTATVMLMGESGTGKNLAAAAIHYQSEAGDRRLVEFNCSAVPTQLLESELFGYVKGAFTGAVQTKRGLVEMALNGTLFLDEIGDLSIEVQAKLLNFLESRSFRRLGATEEIQADQRLITATNHDLDQLIADGKFRADLAYRIRVAEHRMPALREIRSDIPLLADHFVKLYGHKFRKDVQGMSDDFIDALIAWDWPGNVRELRNTIERAVIFASGPVLRSAQLPRFDKAPLSPAPSANSIAIPSGLSLVEAEKEYIRRTLHLCDGNIQMAAEVLGITRKNLWEKRRKYGITA